MLEIEELQRIIWPGNETEVVPVHVLLTAAHNGGLVIGAYHHPENSSPLETHNSITEHVHPDSSLIGYVFGFTGLYITPDGVRPKHCSHMMGVHPDHRDKGVGFSLKRAQWQLVRHQGLNLITWTFDPLISRNANLNISRLGAVCNTYKRDIYGQLRDGINIGLPSDRFQVDWWVNSHRVSHRLSKKPRRKLDLAHYFAAGVKIINPTIMNKNGLTLPGTVETAIKNVNNNSHEQPLLLIEIPANFLTLKAFDASLAYKWRMFTRKIFEDLFQRGYLLTDFVYMPGKFPRSFYVASYGESTL
jgi:predicted GNAT superfamily acetyltransferase